MLTLVFLPPLSAKENVKVNKSEQAEARTTHLTDSRNVCAPSISTTHLVPKSISVQKWRAITWWHSPLNPLALNSYSLPLLLKGRTRTATFTLDPMVTGPLVFRGTNHFPLRQQTYDCSTVQPVWSYWIRKIPLGQTQPGESFTASRPVYTR